MSFNAVRFILPRQFVLPVDYALKTDFRAYKCLNFPFDAHLL